MSGIGAVLEWTAPANANTTGLVAILVTSTDSIVQTIPSITSLRIQPLPQAAAVFEVLGYHQSGDGGGGSFIWNATDTRGDDLGTIIAPTGVATGRWNRVLSGALLSVAHFGAYGDGASHPISSAQATAINATYNIGAAANDETDWVATQVAVIVVSQLSIAANTVANAYRYGAVVTMPQGVFVFNKTLQMRFGVTLQGSGRTAFHLDVSGTYPTGTILTYTGIAAAAAINITGFVAATGLPVAYNVVMQGTDIDAGTYSACEDCTVRDLTLYTAVASVAYGINMNGAPTSTLINVCTNGFQTGINIGACWGGVLERIHVLATLVAMSIGADTNGMSFNDIYLTCTSSATSGSICLQTNFARACHFSRIVCEHAQYAISGQSFIGSVMNGIYFEDISIGCVLATSIYGLTMNGIYFNCLAAYGFKMLNYSQIIATAAFINPVAGTPQIAAVVDSLVPGSSLTLIGFTPTAAERTKDFGSGSQLRYVDSHDGTGNIVQWTMAEGRTINISMPDSSSQYVEQIQVNQTGQWDWIMGPTYARMYDLINSRYAFQFNFTGGSGGGPALLIETSQVVTSRQTGWTAPTGTPSRAGFATSSATVTQLAEFCLAMYADLATHGLVGA